MTLVDWPGSVPAPDQWVTIEGRFDRVANQVPRLTVRSLVPAPMPDDPYE